MLLWNVLVSLFTRFEDYGLPHIPLFIVLFFAMAIVQFLLLKKAKGVAKFLPLIISSSVVLLTQAAIWIIAYIMHSYFALIVVVALTYFVVALLGALLGLIIYLLSLVFLK